MPKSPQKPKGKSRNASNHRGNIAPSSCDEDSQRQLDTEQPVGRKHDDRSLDEQPQIPDQNKQPTTLPEAGPISAEEQSNPISDTNQYSQAVYNNLTPKPGQDNQECDSIQGATNRIHSTQTPDPDPEHETHHSGSHLDERIENDKQWNQTKILEEGLQIQILSLPQDDNALNPAQEETLLNSDKHDNLQRFEERKQSIAVIQDLIATQGSLQHSKDGTELKRDNIAVEKCNSAKVQEPEHTEESISLKESCPRQRPGRRQEAKNRQQLERRDPNPARSGERDPNPARPEERNPSPALPQGQDQEWEDVLKAVKGYRPVHVLIMSLTVQAATTVFVASLVSFFMSQTGWQRPNTVQVPTSSFNVQEAKDDIIQEVLSKLQNTKDQQETTACLNFEQYITDKENLQQLFGALQKKQTDDLNIFHEQYDHDKENQKQFYEAQLKKQAEEWKIFYQGLVKGQYEDLLKKEIDSLTLSYDKKLQATNSTLHKEFEDKLQVVHEQCQVNISSVNNTVLKSLDDARSELTEKNQKLGDKVGAMPKTLEERGFTNIETVGPILMIVAVVEVVLMMCVCGLLCQTSKRGGTGPEQLQANSLIVQTNQHEPPPVNINNRNLAIVCFRNSDEARCRRWTEAITEILTIRPQLVVHVVNSVHDVGRIPACRAALVFVEPDEREMIIEDERYHIGQGLRRLAVQRLMDSRVTVFVVIFNDKRPVNDPGTELFNSRLQQVEEHVQLQRLKVDQRLVSFGRDLSEFQIRHVAEQLAQCFATTTR